MREDIGLVRRHEDLVPMASRPNAALLVPWNGANRVYFSGSAAVSTNHHHLVQDPCVEQHPTSEEVQGGELQVGKQVAPLGLLDNHIHFEH